MVFQYFGWCWVSRSIKLLVISAIILSSSCLHVEKRWQSGEYTGLVTYWMVGQLVRVVLEVATIPMSGVG